MGPLSARSRPGQELVATQPTESKPAGRAKQEVDYGRTQREGYVFGALQPASGEVVTATYTSRSIKNFVGFLDQVEAAIPSSIERAYVVLDNLATHKAYDVLLFNLAHPRLRVCLPAQICGLPQPDRALVENPQIARSPRETLRDLGRG